MISELRATLFRWYPVRWALAILFLASGGCHRLIGRRYRALKDFCWVVRVSGTGWPRALARRLVFRTIERCRHEATNPVLADFRADPAARAVAALYAQSGLGPRDLFRDVMVLKAASDTEKGVILLKYARTFAALAALADIGRLMQRYVFVLEPCWAGYCDPILLMWLTPGQPMPVMCFTEEDHAFVSDVGAPFLALRMGPADWVNADIFRPPAEVQKNYDLVMVANFAHHKRHATLFRALRDLRDRDLRVLLIGFPWHGRTAQHLRAEAASIMRNERVQLEIVESVPHSRVSELVSQSKAFVFLSRKEGDNKALVEAMFANVPAIVYAHSIGGARSRINPQTGVLATDQELAGQIRRMLEDHGKFSPRAWALAHTGSVASTRILDDVLRTAVTAAGGAWTRGIVEKTNAPNLAYRNPGERAAFEADYGFIRSCLFSKLA
jgi:glycosyltransferase involved in cell wall biosynthesis